jgi:hypothetical protein
MSVPLKELQDLARKIPQNERQTVKRFMEFVIERADDTLTAAEAAVVDKAKKDMKDGNWVSHSEVRRIAGL